MSTPTAVMREWMTDRADSMDAFNSRIEVEARAIIDEKCYDNGINLVALAIRAKTEDLQALIIKLRQLSHNRFGSSEEAA